MAEKMVKCAKFGEDLPGIDPDTPKGNQVGRMCVLFGGPELRQRVFDQVSLKAWEAWTDHMRMLMNEFRLDPTSDEANEVLGRHMNDFFFGEEREIPNYVPPE